MSRNKKQSRTANTEKVVARRVKAALTKKRRVFNHRIPVAYASRVYFIKKKESVSNFHTIYSEAKKIPKIWDSLLPNLLPKSSSELCSSGVDDWTLSTDKDLVWTSLVLLDHIEVINKFLEFERRYQEQILKGNYSSCLEIINDLESSLCVSLWSIKERLVLTQKLHGLKKQKALAKSLQDSERGFVSFIASYVSNMIEENTSSLWFKRRLDQIFSHEDQNDPFCKFFIYSIIGASDFEAASATNFVIESLQASIIDIYLAFIRSLQLHLNSQANQADLSKIVRRYIHRLGSSINDYRLTKLALSVGLDQDLECLEDKHFFNILENYTKGNYKEVIDSCKIYLRNVSVSFPVLEIFSKSCLYLEMEIDTGSDSLNKIAKSILEIVSGSGDLQVEQAYLSKVSLEHSSLDFAYEIKSFLRRELSSTEPKPIHGENMEFFNTSSLSPFACDAVSNDSTVARLLEWLSNGRTPLTTSLFRCIRFPNENWLDDIGSLQLPESRKRKIIANKYFSDELFEQAVYYYESLYSCEEPFSAIEVLGKFAVAHLKTDKKLEGCKLISDTYVANPQSHLGLPIKLAVEILGDSDWPVSIDVPIVFFMYTEHISKDKIEHLRYSFEYFLVESGMASPSDLAEQIDTLGETKLSFFFEKICTYDVMKRYIPYKGKNAVDRERLVLYGILSKVQSDRAEYFQDRIKQLTQDIVIREAVEKAGRSKIYVDTDNIRAALSSEVGELLERYRALKENSALDFELSIEHTAVGDGESSRRFIALVRNTANFNNLIRAMIDLVTREFLFGEFGLNNFLSSRVRHGTILNTLSKPLLKENLLTSLDVNTNRYLPIRYWSDKFTSKTDKSILLEAMSKFSESFYEIISQIRDSKIQVIYNQQADAPHICDKSTIGAMFSFKLNPRDIGYIRSHFEVDITYNAFMELVFERLWVQVEHNLESIRSYMSTEINEQFKTLYGQLLNDISAISYSSAKVELEKSITSSRVHMGTAVSEAISWFNRSEAEELSDFGLDIALEVANKLICGFDGVPQFKLVTDIDEGITIKGEYLMTFGDIFYPLLDNVITRSGLAVEERLLNVRALYVENCIELQFSNTTAPQRDFALVNDRLRITIQKHIDDPTSTKLSTEGGTGYFKIIRFIKSALQSEILHFSAKYDDEEHFCVSIGFSAEGLLA